MKKIYKFPDKKFWTKKIFDINSWSKKKISGQKIFDKKIRKKIPGQKKIQVQKISGKNPVKKTGKKICDKKFRKKIILVKQFRFKEFRSKKILDIKNF